MNVKGFFLSIYSFVSLLIVIIFMVLFRNKIHFIRQLWAASMVKLINVDIKEIGELDKEADVILLNHNSMLDVLLLDYLHPKDIAWVANEKLANTPIFGSIFKLPNLILLDPTKINSIKLLTNKIQEEIASGRPIGIFPEGTRGDNDEITDFQKGIKIIAEKLNLKIQPIVLTNTRKRLDTKKYISTPGEVKIIYLDTIQTLKKNWYEELQITFKNTYKNNTGD